MKKYQELFNAFNDMSTRLNLYEEQNIEQLTLERNKLEAVLMSIANGVVVCDNNDNVVLTNNHAHKLLELDEKQKNVYNSLDYQIELSAEDLLCKLQIELSELNLVLLQLEMYGLAVRNEYNKKYLRK